MNTYFRTEVEWILYDMRHKNIIISSQYCSRFDWWHTARIKEIKKREKQERQ